MAIVRIVGVWLIALSLTSLAYGGTEGFHIVFITYGIFSTLPALLALGVTWAIEYALLEQGRNAAALASGPVMGLAFPLFLFAIAPNKSNAAAGMTLLVPMTLGTGLLWSASLLPRLFLFRKKL